MGEVGGFNIDTWKAEKVWASQHSSENLRYTKI